MIFEPERVAARDAGTRTMVLSASRTAHKQFAAIRRETLCWNFDAGNFDTNAGSAPHEIA
jgi:hypothetical protein